MNFAPGTPDEAFVAALARAAGLEKAWAEYPEDVVAAATQALGFAADIAFPETPASEPWPPMRAGAGL